MEFIPINCIGLILIILMASCQKAKTVDLSLSQPIEAAPSLSPPSTTAPPSETLVMSCNGKIAANDFDYTATFSTEGGFSSLEFMRSGERVTIVKLDYDGKNDKGQSIWRGAAYGMADVTLIHLSDRIVQLEDEISVGYDGQWGRGRCVSP